MPTDLSELSPSCESSENVHMFVGFSNDHGRIPLVMPTQVKIDQLVRIILAKSLSSIGITMQVHHM